MEKGVMEGEYPTVDMRMTPIYVVTVSTDNSVALENWIYGVKKLGYNYTVLGLGEKWGGWPWRTNKYIEHIKTLPKGCIVLVVDGNDILFVRGPRSLHRAFKKIGSKIVFGGEPTCCTGQYQWTPTDAKREQAINTIDARIPLNRWKFPNAGCIIGYKDNVLEALERVKSSKDDQAGHLEQYLADPEYLTIDWGHDIVGNVNKPSYRYCVDCSVSDNKDRYELQYWEKTNAEGDVISPTTYVNVETKGIPCIFHFPGKNVNGYNIMGAEMYGEAFRPLNPYVAPSIGKAALFSIATLWKGKTTQ
jgi:hypothetical protein